MRGGRTLLAIMVVLAFIATGLHSTAFAVQMVAGTHRLFQATGSQTVPQLAIHQLGQISRCPGQNVEVVQAVDSASGYIYEEWMGCRNAIGFASSGDGGRHFSKPIVLPQSRGAWDPALAVAPDGTLYVAFMQYENHHTFPVVEASFDHGYTFPQVRELIAPGSHNFGDREFIAVGPDGTIYLTWVYGPINKLVKSRCFEDGSCTTIAGDINEVMQVSIDGGRTWGGLIHLSPGYPASGVENGALVVEQNGRIDVEYARYHVLNEKDYKFGPGRSYFTSSVDGGRKWSAPVLLGPSQLTMSVNDWWINGDIGIDAAGNLYTTWDTQVDGQDVGWLSYSTNHGVTWSPLQRVNLDRDNALHIVEVVGGQPGVAYIAWLTDSSPRGYALYVRPFSIRRGWLSQPILVSAFFGNKEVWPGDTFGVSTFPAEHRSGWPRILLSWGSAVGAGRHPDSEIFAAVVTYQP